MNLNMDKDFLGKILVLVSVFVLGLLVFVIIQKPFLYIDEWFTKGVLNLSFGQMMDILARDVHPPIYYIIVKIPIKILHMLNIPFDMLILMKMMSVVPYVLILLIALTKIRSKYGWLACGMFSLTVITMTSFFYAFAIARMYSWGILFLLVTFIYALELLEEPNLKNWAIVTVFCILSAYSHYFIAIAAFMIYALLFLYFIFKNKSQLKYWFASTVICILSYVPWVLTLIHQVSTVNDGYWIKPITFNTFTTFFGTIFTKTNDFTFNLILMIIFIAFVIVVLIQYRKGESDLDYMMFGIGVYLGTLVIGVTISFVLRPIMVARYLIPAIAVFWLAFSIYASELDFKKIVIPLVVVLLLLSAVNLSGELADIEKDHKHYVKNQKLLEKINKNNSVVIIPSMVKYIHFHSDLNETNLYSGVSVDEREKSPAFGTIAGDKEYNFLIPDDIEKYKDKNIYLTYRKADGLHLPDYVKVKHVGSIENCNFCKINITQN